MAIFSGNSDEIKVHIDRITPCVLENLALNGNKLKWTNDLERLKHFIEEIVGIKGKWSSPGGGSRRFKSQCGQFQVTWYFKKQSTLLFQGELAEDLAVKLKEAITKAIEDAENLAKHTGEGESKDEQDNVSLDQTALNQTELQHLHSEKLIEAINDIKVQIQKLKIDTKENQTSISKLTALSQVEHPKPDESFELHKLRQENEDYRCQNENLLRENAEKTERMNNLAYILSDLNTKIKIIEDEKASLVTAISLLNDDYRQKEHAYDQSLTVNKQNDWTKVKGLKDGAASTVRANSNGHDCYVVENSNRYTILNDEVCGNNSNVSESNNNSKNKDHSDDIGKHPERNPDASECNRDTSSIASTDISNTADSKKKQKRKYPERNRDASECHRVASECNRDTPCKKQKRKKKTVVVAGDSLVKNVIGAKMSSIDTDNFFVVKPFPGATVEDMNDFINPLIRKKPDKMILHVGTNNLKSSSPKVVAESILKLVTRIKEASPNTAVGISALLVRNDNHELAVKVNLVNNILRGYSINANISYLGNANIDSSHLNSRGLHLNSIGSSILQDNFREFANNLN